MAKRYSLAGCRASNNRWDFPKGEIEPGEEPLAAARREVAEETGLTDLRFRWGECFTDTPPYAQGKVARYYIAESRTEEVVLPVNPQLGTPEHHEFRWAGYPAAATLLGERVGTILAWAWTHIGDTSGDRSTPPE